MIISILATSEPYMIKPPPTPTLMYIILLLSWIRVLVMVTIMVLMVICLIRLIKFLGNARNEMKLIRMEVGKIAEEVHLLRQELKGGESSIATS